MKLWWARQRWHAKLALSTWPFFVVAWGLAALLIPDFSNQAEPGCFWTDAMLPYVGCRGTVADDLFSFVLTLPLTWLFFMPFLIIATVFGVVQGKLVAVPLIALCVCWFYSVFQLVRAFLAAVGQAWLFLTSR